MNQIIVSALNPKFKSFEKPLKRVVRILLKAFPRLKNLQVEVYLVGYETIKKNVLAFPAPKNFIRPDLKGLKLLGEIYLNPDYIRNEKLEMRNEKKLNYMVIHGFLHLLGYGHKNISDTIIMQNKEQELLNKLRFVTMTITVVIVVYHRHYNYATAHRWARYWLPKH